MEITIIGWYGTETIGDRAILAGIFRILSESIGDFTIRLGSLFPFYTQRTLLEDIDFYKTAACNKNLSINIFDSRNPCELKRNIKQSSLLMVGGGPLMDLREMSMLDYAFSLATKYRIKSVLMGTGWGPLTKEETINIAKKLVKKSSLVIFRDNISKETAIKNGCDSSKVTSLIDPAFIACMVYLESPTVLTDDYISINFRDVELEGNHYLNHEVSTDIFANIVKSVLSKSNYPIHLVPMHNFFIGGDDRIILSKIANKVASDRIKVLHHPLSLKQTMDEFYNANYSVGMRFHSVVLQTALNGRNFIIDYTDPQNGKIISMIKNLGMENTYRNRYLSLHSPQKIYDIDINQIEQYNISNDYLQDSFSKYCSYVRRLIDRC